MEVLKNNARDRYQAGQISSKTFVEFRLIWLQTDLIVIISGGRSHIGSIAHSEKAISSDIRQFTFQGHREDKIVHQTAESLKSLVTGELLVIGGIHYDQISKEQIGVINANCTLLINQIAEDLKIL